jgi:hypothetical protein
MNEAKIQSQCYIWYNNNYCLQSHNPRGVMFSVPNELAGANKIAMMQAKAIGLTSGVSDTIVILPNGKILFIEFKDEKGIQSQRQKHFEKLITDLGHNYYLVRNVNQFQQTIWQNLK